VSEDKVVRLPRPGSIVEDDPLLCVLRDGAQRMLMQAIETEVEAFIALHAGEVDEDGRRRVVRNGHGPERSLQTGIGPIKVRRPKIRDRQASIYKPIRFSSAVLPAYLRRTKNIEELLPWLYLKGVSTGQFDEALRALLGPGAPGLSATTIRRLTADWQDEHKRWQDRDLSAKTFVYLWADGVYFRPRPDDHKQCVLVLIGADETGRKELLAIDDGIRESAQSWRETMIRLRDQNGLKTPPKLAIGDGALGFWKALHEIWPAAGKQRCWVHKTANVLNAMPKSVQSKAKSDLHEIYKSPGREEAEKAVDRFVSTYGAKYDKAVECLTKDREEMLAFYDFPAEHWKHLRTANPIESTFATVRLRTHKTKGCLSRKTALAMVYKLAQTAQKTWRQLNGSQQIGQLIKGFKFRDGEPVQNTAEGAAA